MNIKVICSIRNAKIPKSIDDFSFQGFQVFLYEQKEFSKFITDRLRKDAGDINLKEFIDAPYFSCFMEVKDEAELIRLSNQALSVLSNLSTLLWFAKDCSVDLGYMYFFNEEACLCRLRMTVVSNSSGEYKEIELTKEDLQIAANVFNIIKQKGGVLHQKEVKQIINKNKPTITDSSYHYSNYNEHNRIIRALSFLNIARSNSFMPFKIALYIAVFECLFNTSPSEITYKIAQRAALYIGGDSETKLKNFEIVEGAYDTRSKFFHGQKLDNTKQSKDTLSNESKSVDDLLRQILTKIIFEDYDLFAKNDDNDKELVKYLKGMMFNK